MRKLLFLFPITLVMATVMSCSGKGDRHTVDSVEFDGSASASASAPPPPPNIYIRYIRYISYI